MDEHTADQHAGFKAWMSLLRVHQKILSRIVALLAGYNLTLAQFDVLARLHYQEGITQQQLADRLLVTKGNVSGLIDRLSQQGLVERRPDSEDRRSHLLYLTKTGKELITTVLLPHKAQLINLMNVLSEAQQNDLLALLLELETLIKTE